MKFRLSTLCLVGLLASCSDDTVSPEDMGTDVPVAPDMQWPDVAEDMANDTDVSSPEPDMDMAPPDMPDADVDMNVVPTCRTLAPADRGRKLVVAKPYAEGGTKKNSFDVYDLSAAGELTSVSTTFELGNPATSGTIVFTPDGEIGIARLDNGTLGSFRVGATDVQVLQAAHDPGEYISDIIFPPGDGSVLYAVKVGWRNTGGGLYAIPVDCETGMLGEATLIAPSKLLYGIAFDQEKRAFVAAMDILDSEEPNHIHEMVLDPIPQRLQSGRAFPDDDAIMAGFDITPDASIALIGDTNVFGQNRLGVVKLQAPMTSLQVLEIEDPEDIIVSPYGNAAVVASVFGDSLLVLDISNDPIAPVSIRGELSTANPVLLPGNMVALRRGSLTGNVWVSENVGLRRIRFEPNGTVTDVSFTSTGEGVLGISGAFGIQP